MRLRNTTQRNALEQAFADSRFLFSAETLHKEVSRQHKKIGIATVYRFLNSLAAERKVHVYSCNRQTLYSSSNTSHCHFTCENCKAVRHIPLKKLDFLQEEIKGNICHFQIDVTGVCGKCKNEKPR